MFRTVLLRALIIAALLSSSVPLALAAPGDFSLPGSTFESKDGNLVAGAPGYVDWATYASDPTLHKGTDLPTGQTDDSLVQGTKEDTPVPTVEFGSIPNNKSDLQRFYVKSQKESGKDFLYLAWTRANTLGTANMDFEFNQSSVLSSNGKTPVRTDGDILITFDFAAGGKNVQLGLLRWVTSGATSQCFASNALPCWGKRQDLSAAGFANGAVNDGFSTTNPLDNNATLLDKTFGEAAIDLNGSGVFQPNACVSFGQAYLKSRSSDSFTAALKDFIAPIPVSVSNCGGITIIKDAAPNDQHDFSFSATSTTTSSIGLFSLDDDSDPTLPSSRTFNGLKAGTYTVTEGTANGWDLTGLACTDPTSDSSGNLVTRTATINLVAGENVTCTFTNTKRGSITIVKDAQPDDAQDFSYTTTGAGLSSFSLDDDGNTTDPAGLSNTRTFSNLVPGSYTVTEGAASGWDLTNLVCIIPTGGSSTATPDLTLRTATIGLAAGESVTCTYTNTKQGSIIIVKNAVPDDAQDFSYTTTGAGLSGFSLDDDGDTTDPTGLSNTKVFSNLQPGSYTVTEGTASGWDLTDLACSTGGAGDKTTGTATITLAAGASVTCTYTNTKRASITIVKDVVPDNAQDFGYTATGTGLSGFQLDDDPSDTTLSNTITFSNLVPGSYTVTEGALAGWDLTGLQCTDPTSDSSGDLVTRTATINLAAGESVICYFTNTERGSITIVKNAVPDDAQDFGYTTTGAGMSSFSLDDDGDTTGPTGLSNTRTFSNLQPGSYTVTETAAPGWDLTNLACSTGGAGDKTTGTATITLAAGASVTCTYTNTKRASITIVKDVVPDDAQDFSYTTTGAGLSGFSLDDDGDTTDPAGLSNTTTFSDLVAGSYTVTETVAPGWDLTSLVCSTGGTGDTATATATITLAAGASVTCTFTNIERASITIVKDAAPNHTADFSYTSTSSTETTIGSFALDDDGDNTDNAALSLLPSSRTFSSLKPGAYTVTEGTLAGWELTKLECTTPSGGSSTTGISGATATINLAAGEHVTCTYTNTGRATIVIVKDAQPNDAQDFTYTTTGDGLSGFILDDDGDNTDNPVANLRSNTRTFNNVLPGQYTVTEAAANGWSLTGLSCDDANSTGNPGTRTATVNVEPGETVTCTFTNSLLLVLRVQVVRADTNAVVPGVALEASSLAPGCTFLGTARQTQATGAGGDVTGEWTELRLDCQGSNGAGYKVDITTPSSAGSAFAARPTMA